MLFLGKYITNGASPGIILESGYTLSYKDAGNINYKKFKSFSFLFGNGSFKPIYSNEFI